MDNDFGRFFYRETVRDSATGDESIIRRSNAGDEYAHVRISLHPLTRGQGNVFAWNAGSEIPPRFVSPVMQGIQAALSGGVLGGFEVTDVHVCIEGGSYHDSDSNDLVFKDAAEKATAKALRLAQPIILEALVATTISIPEEFTGSVLETVHACGEAIQTMQVEGAATSLAANFAASQAHKLVAKVLTSTQGRANLSMVILGFIESKPEPPEDWAVVT